MEKNCERFYIYIVNVYETMLLRGPLMLYDMHTYTEIKIQHGKGFS